MKCPESRGSVGRRKVRNKMRGSLPCWTLAWGGEGGCCEMGWAICVSSIDDDERGSQLSSYHVMSCFRYDTKIYILKKECDWERDWD